MAGQIRTPAQSETEAAQQLLVTLLFEIQRMIIEDLHRLEDLCALCRCCKLLKSAVQPFLYRHVRFNVPLQTEEKSISIIEELANFSPQGLQFTNALTIRTKYDGDDSSLLRRNAFADDGIHQIQGPCIAFDYRERQASALNVALRLFLKELPVNRLLSFRWDHLCPLEEMTLKRIAQRHSATLHDFQLNGRYENERSDISYLDGLTVLHLMDLDNVEHLYIDMVAKNWKTLRSLYIGNELTVATKYNHIGEIDDPDYGLDEMTHDVVVRIEQTTKSESKGISFTNPPLEELRICGIGLESIARSTLLTQGVVRNLTSLTLESCFGLSDELARLIHSGALGPDSTILPRLKAFYLRQEDANDTFITRLQTFLTSFKGLQHLHILLMGRLSYPILEAMLDGHGETLKTLVWDLQSEHRSLSNVDTLPALGHRDYLEQVSEKCSGLIGLGFVFDWELLKSPQQSSASLPFENAKAPKLETLNIRNMTRMKTPKYWEHGGRSRQTLATSFANIALIRDALDESLQKLSKNLRILALGALKYDSVRIGPHRLNFDEDRDVLTLRLYMVHYLKYYHTKYIYLSEIAMGAVDDSCSQYGDISVFKMYWLSQF